MSQTGQGLPSGVDPLANTIGDYNALLGQADQLWDRVQEDTSNQSQYIGASDTAVQAGNYGVANADIEVAKANAEEGNSLLEQMADTLNRANTLKQRIDASPYYAQNYRETTLVKFATSSDGRYNDLRYIERR